MRGQLSTLDTEEKRIDRLQRLTSSLLQEMSEWARRYDAADPDAASQTGWHVLGGITRLEAALAALDVDVRVELQTLIMNRIAPTEEAAP